MTTTRVEIDIFELVQLYWDQVKNIEDEYLRTVLFCGLVGDTISIILEYKK
jgi:hypothetical protein